MHHTLFLLLSHDCKLAKIWLSMACTQASLSSYVVASKCQVWPVRDTMINSKFSSCSVKKTPCNRKKRLSLRILIARPKQSWLMSVSAMWQANAGLDIWGLRLDISNYPAVAQCSRKRLPDPLLFLSKCYADTVWGKYSVPVCVCEFGIKSIPFLNTKWLTSII